MSTCLGIWNQRYGEETFKQVAVINRNPWLRPSGLSGLRFTGLGGRDFPERPAAIYRIGWLF